MSNFEGTFLGVQEEILINPTTGEKKTFISEIIYNIEKITETQYFVKTTHVITNKVYYIFFFKSGDKFYSGSFPGIDVIEWNGSTYIHLWSDNTNSNGDLINATVILYPITC